MTVPFNEVNPDDKVASDWLQVASALPCDGYHHYYHYQSSAQYLWLGRALQLLGKYEDAAKSYKNSIFQDHFNAEALKWKKEAERQSREVLDACA